MNQKIRRVKKIFLCSVTFLFIVKLIVNTQIESKAEFVAPYYNINDNGGEWDGTYYTLDGRIIKDSFFCDGKYTYYLQADGTPMTDRLTYHPDGEHVIYFDEYGHEVFNDFMNVKESISGDSVDDFCYFDVYGYMYTNVVTYNQKGDTLYYANPYGVMECTGWFKFDENVGGIADALGIDGNTYAYANPDGSIEPSSLGNEIKSDILVSENTTLKKVCKYRYGTIYDELIYNKKGNILFEILYDYYGYSDSYGNSISGDLLKVYDSYGNLLKEFIYDNNYNIYNYTEYGADGNIIKKYNFDYFNDYYDYEEYKYNYSYDSNGKIIDSEAQCTIFAVRKDIDNKIMFTEVSEGTTYLYKFDDMGNIILESKYDNGNLISENSYKYDDNDILIEYGFNDFNSPYMSWNAVLNYDEYGSIEKQTVYNDNGEIINKSQHKNEYDDEGKLIKETYDGIEITYTYEYWDENDEDISYKIPEKPELIFKKDGYSSKERIIKNGVVAKETEYDSSYNMIYYELYEYDSKNHMTKMTRLLPGDLIDTFYEYEYDLLGNRIKETCYDSTGEKEYYVFFEYDTDGNMIKQEGYYRDENGEYIKEVIRFD